MCGIWALFGYDLSRNGTDQRMKALESAFKVACRGPDCFQIQNISAVRNCYLTFHRLCLVDPVRGMQPMNLSRYPHFFLSCNGEIYNFEKLKKEFGFVFETCCDCEIILHLYNKFGIEKTTQLLDGTFSFLLLDTRSMTLVLARDSYGVRPLFYFVDKPNEALGICSEMKGLIDLLNIEDKQNSSDKVVQPFPPGSFMVFQTNELGKLNLVSTKQFHSFENQPLHFKYQELDLKEGDDLENIRLNIRNLLTNAVEKRLMTTHREIGLFLSGGLDSSLVAGIAAKKLKTENRKLKTFSIGFPSSLDILAARKVAKHIGSDHYEVIVPLEDVLQVIDDVSYLSETFDPVTFRGNIAMCLLSKFIKHNTDAAILLSGEGADELTQGYLYFHQRPSPEEADKESRRLLKDLYLYDVLRVDRCTAAYGLEIRVPFLDHAFTAYYLSLPAKLRCPTNGYEKYLLRSSFEGTGLIPDDILWRKKMQFSAAMSSEEIPWFKSSRVTQFFEERVSDKELEDAKFRYSHCTPTTKEALYYRRNFEQRFGRSHEHHTPYFWTPKWVH